MSERFYQGDIVRVLEWANIFELEESKFKDLGLSLQSKSGSKLEGSTNNKTTSKTLVAIFEPKTATG
jgi:hypothetical protein